MASLESWGLFLERPGKLSGPVFTGSFEKQAPGPGCWKPDHANPGLARILISVLQLFGEVFCLYCLTFSLEFE